MEYMCEGCLRSVLRAVTGPEHGYFTVRESPGEASASTCLKGSAGRFMKARTKRPIRVDSGLAHDLLGTAGQDDPGEAHAYIVAVQDGLEGLHPASASREGEVGAGAAAQDAHPRISLRLRRGKKECSRSRPW